MISIGDDLNTLTVGPDKETFARAAELFAIDYDDTSHEKNGLTYSGLIIGDIYQSLTNLLKLLNQAPLSRNKWISQCVEWKRSYGRTTEFTSTADEIDLHDFAYHLPDLMGETGIFICDSGFIDVIVPTNAYFQENQRCIRPISQGSMGFALPAVVGTSFSTQDPIICAVGDGSIMFNLQELETISRYQIPVLICVFVNNMYAVIKRRQNLLFRGRTFGVNDETGLANPNFEKIAGSFDITYQRTSAKDYVNCLKNLQNTNVPVLIELPSKADQNYLEIAYAKTSNRSFKRRPLEDQKPFLPREELLSNMLIEALDE